MSRAPRLSVVIPSRDSRDLTSRCLRALCADPLRPEDLEIWLVDDASRDDSIEVVQRRFPAVRVLTSREPKGFTASANRGLSSASGELLLLLNSDTEVDSGALARAAAAFDRDHRLGVAGAKLRFPDGRAQWSGGRVPTLPWMFGLSSGLARCLGKLPGYRRLRSLPGEERAEVGWVTGAAMMFRRRVWEQVGPLDESFHFYAQDLDFCVRARAEGWSIEILREFQVAHHHGATIGRTESAVARQSPELLWVDLVRWASKHKGGGWGRQVALVLRVGGLLRVTYRKVVGLLLWGNARHVWRRESRAFGRALSALRDEVSKLRS